MNESLLMLQSLLIILFSFFAIRLGKEATIALIALQALLANLFVIKQIALFGINATASDAFAVGSLFTLNLLRQRFGKESAKHASLLCFFLLLFFALLAQLHLSFIPSVFDSSQTAYAALLLPAPRLFLASIFTFLCIQRLDLYLFDFFQKSCKFSTNQASSFSLLTSQIFDTALFTMLGLYGLVAAPLDVFLISLGFKLLCSAGFIIANFLPNKKVSYEI